MPDRPIIQIEVDDEKFKRFLEVFHRYQDDVKSSGHAWTQAGADQRQAFDEMFNRIGRAETNVKKLTNSQRELLQLTERTGSSFIRLGEHMTKTFHRLEHLIGMGGKLALLLSGATGGAIFGLDRLAAGLENTASASRGIGITTGQQRAFAANFTGIAPTSLPSSVFNAQHNLQDVASFGLIFGGNGQRVMGENSAQASIALLTRARQFGIDNRNDLAVFNTSNPVVQAFQRLGLSLQDIERLANTPQSQLASRERRFGIDSRRFNNDRQVDEMMDFMRKLREAGLTFVSTLDKDLGPIMPRLGSSMKALAGDIASLVDDVLTPAHIHSIDEGLTDFIHTLGSAHTKQDIEKFAHALGTMTDMITGFAHTAVGKALIGAYHASQTVASAVHHDVGVIGAVRTNDRIAHYIAAADAADRRAGNPAGTGAALMALENRTGNPALTSRTGAVGLLQIEPSTARALGIDPATLTNPRVNIALGERIMHGDLQRARALLPKGGPIAQTELARLLYSTDNHAVLASLKRSLANGTQSTFLQRMPDAMRTDATNYIAALADERVRGQSIFSRATQMRMFSGNIPQDAPLTLDASIGASRFHAWQYPVGVMGASALHGYTARMDALESEMRRQTPQHADHYMGRITRAVIKPRPLNVHLDSATGSSVVVQAAAAAAG